MRVLVLGGTGLIGPHIVRRLMAQGHGVTVFRRGRGVANLPEGVGVLVGDRNRLEASAGAFRDLRPDVVVDVIAFTEEQAKTARIQMVIICLRMLSGRSSAAVFRIRPW